MASVTLVDLWIHLAATPDDYVTVDTLGTFSVARQVDAEVRTYAGGRRRLVRRAGRPRQYTATFPVQRGTLAWLRAHEGETMMLRDPTGRLVFGAYLSMAEDEDDGGDWLNVTIVVDETTHSIEA